MEDCTVTIGELWLTITFKKRTEYAEFRGFTAAQRAAQAGAIASALGYGPFVRSMSGTTVYQFRKL